MNCVYQLMSQQAQFWSDSWERGPSWRKPIFGNSDHIYNPRKPLKDDTLGLPAAPGRDLKFDPSWMTGNARRLQLASDSLTDNDELVGLLHENMRTVGINRYNLEVYLSIADLYRQNLEMLLGLRRMCFQLESAQKAASQGKPKDALESMDGALGMAEEIRRQRNEALRNAIATWYKSWFPRTAEANGRKFLHELDDVKDHVPDRTVDMSYLVERELRLPLGEWVAALRASRNQFAGANHLAADTRRFDWLDLETGR